MTPWRGGFTYIRCSGCTREPPLLSGVPRGPLLPLKQNLCPCCFTYWCFAGLDYIYFLFFLFGSIIDFEFYKFVSARIFLELQ